MSGRKNIISMKIIPTSDILKDEPKNNKSRNVTSAAHMANQPSCFYSLLSNSGPVNMPESAVLNDNYAQAPVNYKKRDTSKSISQSRKKGKVNAPIESRGDDINIDNDLAAIVKTLTPVTNIDSDSSTTTSFNDDDNKMLSKNELTTSSDKDKTCSKLKFSQNSLKQKLILPKQSTLLNAVPYTSSSYLLPHYPSPSSSLLQEALIKNSQNMQTVASVTFNILPSIITPETNSNSHLLMPKIRERKNQPKSLMYGLQNTIKTEVMRKDTNLPISDVSQINTRLNHKSVYESMGLDEDLCDVNPSISREGVCFRNTTPESSSSFIEVNKCNSTTPNDLLNVSIKVERDATPPPDAITGKESDKLNISSQNESNKVHISMEFEEDTTYNDDVEDDLPLSFLKGRLLVNEISTSNKSQTSVANVSNNENEDVPLSLFIKKELIEDEIVSESQEISTKNLSHANSSIKEDSLPFSTNKQESDKNLSSGLFYNPTAIKTEPESDHESSEVSAEVTNSLFSQESSTVSVLTVDKTVAEDLKIPKKRKFKNAPKTARKKKNQNNHTMQDETLKNSNESIATSLSSVPSNNCLSEDTVIKNSLPESSDYTSENNLIKTGTSQQASGNLEQSVLKSQKKGKSSAGKTGKRSAKKAGGGKKKTQCKTDANIQIENNTNVNFQEAASEELTKNSKMNSQSNNSNITANYVMPALEEENKRSVVSRKGRRKKAKKSVSVDENLPITLLIKRSKFTSEEVNTPESFSYTSVSKTVTSEANLSSNQSNSSGNILPSENPSSVNEIDKQDNSIHSSSYLETSNFEENTPVRKPTNKKKRVKKKRTKNNSNAVSETVTDNKMILDNNMTSSSLDIRPSTDLLSNVDSDKTVDSPFTIENNLNKVLKNSEDSLAESNKTLIYMSFDEEQSPPNETSKDLNSVISSSEKEKDTTEYDAFSVIKNIKKENDFAVDSKLKTEELAYNHSAALTIDIQHSIPLSSENRDVSEVYSDISTSNSNFSDVSRLSTNKDQVQLEPQNSTKKKKKKRPRSYGWYKKKKKTRVTNKKTPISVTEAVLSTEELAVSGTSLSLINNNLTTSTTSKMPVVVIKNLCSAIKTSSVAEAENIQNDSQSFNQDLVSSSVRNEGKKDSNKRKSTQFDEIDSSETIPLKTAEIEVTEMSEQEENPDMHSRKKSNDVLKESDNLSSHNTSTQLTITSSACEETELADIVSKYNTELSSDNYNFTGEMRAPSINVDKVAESIAVIESFLQQKQKMLQNAGKECENNLELSKTGGISDLNKLNSHSKNISISSAFSSNAALSSDVLNVPVLKDLVSDIQIKKEKDDKYSQNPVGSSNQLRLVSASNSVQNSPQISNNSSNIISSVKDPICNDTQSFLQNSGKNSSLISLASIKKEMCIGDNSQDLFLKELFAADSVSRSHSLSDDRLINQGTDKNLPFNSKDKSLLNVNNQNASVLLNSSVNNSQSKPPDFCNKVALAIKKEVCDDTRTGSLKYASLNEIKNQNELIEKVSSVCSKQGDNTSAKLIFEQTTSKSVPSANPDDDDIQIIATDLKKSKNVPCVDLTDDNLEHQEMSQGINAKDIEMNKNGNLSIKNLDMISNDNSMMSENKQKVVDCQYLNSDTKSDDSQNFLNLSEKKVTDSAQNFGDEDMSDDDKEIVYPAIVKDKYKTEYLKHPYPPTVMSYQNEKRNKNKMYSRINCKAWNLSLNQVKSRLKLSEYKTSQLEDKSGDNVKLEKYSVSGSEAECYHRILGVAPSHKLLSKCFKSPDSKMNTIVNPEFDSFWKYHQTVDLNKFEEKTTNPISCSLNDITLNDIIQGISESKMMCNPKVKINSELFDRNCPSADTKDSCDSHLSTFSDKFINKKEFKLQIKDTEFSEFSNETSSSSVRNFALPTETLTAQDLLKSSSSYINIKHSVEGCHGSNKVSNVSSTESILNNLTLPSKEVLDSLSKKCETASLSHIDVTTNKLNYEPPYTDKSHLSDSHKHHSLLQSSEILIEPHKPEKPNSFLNACSSNVNHIDVPVAELRKILETAGNLCLDVNSNENVMWRSKTTFEYNHIQSIPLVETGSQLNGCSVKVDVNNSHLKSPERERTNLISDTSKPINTQCSIEVSNNTANQTNCDNSDDDYIDNEPVGNELDDENDESSNSKAHSNKEPVKIPQYKSRWEKIMERKSRENESKEKINENLLKDCFPVSAKKILSKKSIGTEKSAIKPKEKMLDCLPASAKKVVSKKSIGTEKSTLKSDEKMPEKSKKKADRKTEHAKSNKTKDNKAESSKQLSPKKNKGKGKDLEVTSNLFVPDKPIQNSNVSKTADSKKAENKEKESKDKNDNKKLDEHTPAKRFYGNRVTNRGSFLTESRTAEFLKKIKIPKKKPSEVSKKSMNVRSEEFHSMVKSPDIDIIPPVISSYNNVNKSAFKSHKTEFYGKNSKTEFYGKNSKTEFYGKNSKTEFYGKNSKREFYGKNSNYRTFSSSSSHHLESRYEQNRSSFTGKRANLYTSEEKDVSGRRPSLLTTPPPLSQPLNTENGLRKASVLSSVPFHQPNNDDPRTRKTGILNTLSSITSQLPVKNPFQVNTDSQKSLVESILSAIQSKSSPPVPEVRERILPFSEYLHPTGNANQHTSSNRGYETLALQNNLSGSLNMRDESALSVPSTSHRNDFSSPGSLSILHSIPGLSSSSFTYRKQMEPASDPSQILKSPPIAIPSISSHVTPQTARRTSSTCLVPQHLKTIVGHEIVDTQNVRLLILEWSVDWLVQQQKFHDPPPISNALKKVVSSYDSFEDYYNTYFPLMLLDTWHRIYVSWTHLSQVNPYYCEITSYSVKSSYVSVECQTVFNTANHPKGVFPDEGSILMVKYGTKSNEFTIKILGYVTSVKTRRFNHVTDSKMCGYKSPKEGNYINIDVLQVLTLTFMGAYNSEEIDKRLPVRIHVLCNVKSTLKQNDALLYTRNSPLHGSILNPVEHGLITVALTPRNSAPEKVNECVRDITKGILSPHPLPLLTIVRARPESDRLNIIPLLIDKMKNSYKTKVLLCVRTVRALGDIAANICLHDSLKLVIINKRCDTNPQFQKYLLDELVSHEISKLPVGALHAKNEAIMRAKKQIFKECDVVLSLIRNCHDEFMEETFTETESVAQMCCIIDEANLCTEPETLIPILHGISKLILIGDPDYPAKVLSKTASSYDYNRSFFQRAYDLDSITD